MNQDPKGSRSRRNFMRLTAAGAAAWGALPVLSPAAGEAKKTTVPADAPLVSPRSQWRRADAMPASNDPESHTTLSLNGSWSVTALPLEAEGESGYRTLKSAAPEFLAAQVPGELHLDLMRAGRMDDPDISDNARARCRWPEQHSWWYRRELFVPPGFHNHWRQCLTFDGIDLNSQIFVNGRVAASSQSAFAPVEVDVKPLLQEGTNEIVVRVTSGMELIPSPRVDAATYARPTESAANLDPLHRIRSFIFEKHRVLRKAAYTTYGWDFCDPLPNLGIWRDVRLEGRSQVILHHVRLDTVIRGDAVALEGELILENLHAWSEIPATLYLQLDDPDGRESIVRQLSINAPVGRSPVACRIEVPKARLWWPNGMGEQPLYKLQIRVFVQGRETDRQVQTLGLRTLELNRAALPEGSRFGLKVNGQNVYCKGGNWAPPDLIPARMDTGRYEHLVSEAKRANFTMLRVNGVGIYEADEFYEACDRAGILVWQDFMFSCALYPDRDQEFMRRVRKEARAVVRRLRHHASMALWCATNECTMTMASTKSDDGARIYNELLPDVCRLYDPMRPFWPGSPFGGDKPNSEISGDNHGWVGEGTVGPADELTQEVADRSRARFMSEYGTLGPAHLESIRQYLKPEEMSLDSAAWRIHTNLADSMLGGYLSTGIRIHYGEPQHLSLEQFVLYGQMFQAQLQGRALDALRFRKDDPRADCQGALVWSYNDTWGETGWSIIDHYLRRKASYYGFRRSAAAVKVLVRSRSGHLVTRVVNDTLRTYRATVRCGWMRLDGRASELQEHVLTIPSNGMIEVTRVPMPSVAERNPREWLYAAVLSGTGLDPDQSIWLFEPQRSLALVEPVISSVARDGVLAVSSPVYCHGVHMDDGGHEVLADNYFDLLPGIPRHISITVPMSSGAYPLQAVLPIGWPGEPR